MLKAGCSESEVDAVVEEAWQAHVGAQRTRGLVELVVGVVMLVAGIGITAATYNAAEEAGGGTYVLTYGLIICGILGLFRGAVRLAGGR